LPDFPLSFYLLAVQDGDVTIRSSDGVLFRVHKVNLDIASEAFPPAINVRADDVVDFAEDAGTLEILLYFVYPSRPIPDLGSLPFETLMK